MSSAQTDRRNASAGFRPPPSVNVSLEAVHGLPGRRHRARPRHAGLRLRPAPACPCTARCAGRCGARSPPSSTTWRSTRRSSPLRASEGVGAAQRPGAFVYATRPQQGQLLLLLVLDLGREPARADEVSARLEAIAGASRMRERDFHPRLAVHQRLGRAAQLPRSRNWPIRALLDEAYPSLGVPVAEFIAALPRRTGVRADPAGTARHRQDAPGARHPRRDLASQGRKRAR